MSLEGKVRQKVESRKVNWKDWQSPRNSCHRQPPGPQQWIVSSLLTGLASLPSNLASAFSMLYPNSLYLKTK